MKFSLIKWYAWPSVTLSFQGLNLTSRTGHFLSILEKNTQTLVFFMLGSSEVNSWSTHFPHVYVNDMARAVDCDLLLYTGDSCSIFRDKYTEKIDSNLNRSFHSLCHWVLKNQTKHSF